jgi:hypothetical protein
MLIFGTYFVVNGQHLTESIKNRRDKKVGRVKMLQYFHFQTKLFSEFTFQSFRESFSEFQASPRKLHHIPTPYIFFQQ